MTLNWSDNAVNKLREHVRNIVENSDQATAGKWLKGLYDNTSLIENFPTIAPLSRIPDLAKLGIHELTYGNYRVFYVIRENDCRVISILNCRQNVTFVGDL